MYISSDSRYKKINEKFQKFETSNMSPNIKILWDKGDGVHVSDNLRKNILILPQVFSLLILDIIINFCKKKS